MNLQLSDTDPPVPTPSFDLVDVVLELRLPANHLAAEPGGYPEATVQLGGMKFVLEGKTTFKPAHTQLYQADYSVDCDPTDLR